MNILISVKDRLVPAALAAVFIMVSFAPGTGGALMAQEKSRSYREGTLARYGRVEVLSLKGNYREMGRQYGALSSGALRDFYGDIVSLLAKGRGIPVGSLEAYGVNLYNRYPHRFKEILCGMAETSGLDITAHCVINAFEHYMFNPEFASKDASWGCSAVAAWGPYTKSGEVLFGRNYDFGSDVAVFKKYLNVTVYNPEGAGLSTAVVTFCGTLNATTEMNSSGLFLELNNGGLSAGGLVRRDRISSPVNLFGILLDFSDMAGIEGAMNTINSDAAYIINAADGDGARSYEWSPAGVKIAPPVRPGLLVSTNHFVGPWKGPAPSDRFYMTVTRRKNLEALADKSRGEIDLGRMKEIMDRPIELGGAVSLKAGKIGKNPAPYTAYQVIALPREKTLWLKLPLYQDWTEVRLKDHVR